MTLIEQLLAPIPGDKAAGHYDEDSAAYLELDQLMLKYGTLHQNSIDWARVNQLAEQILSQQSKHYRVLSHQITYWLIKQGSIGLSDSMRLLDGYLQTYWLNGYPKPGTAGIKYRRRQVEQILFRIDKQAPRILQTAPTDNLLGLQIAREQLGKTLKKRKLDPGLKQLDQHLKALVEKPEAVPPAETKSTPKTPPGTPPITPQNIIQEARQIKRLLLQQAEQLNQQQPADPLGYQLRRHALWSDIKTAPTANKNGKTELSAPPGDLINHYQEQLKNQTSTLALFQQLENSVTASPFWLQGSSMAIKMAEQLKLTEVAAAITASTQAFIARIPALQHRIFRGGEPYINEKDLAQINTQQTKTPNNTATPEETSANTIALPEWAKQQQSLDTLRETDGIAAVLQKIEQQQQAHTAPRERCYLKLLASEQLQKAGLHSLAHDLVLTTQRSIKNMTVAEWEPIYLQRLQASLKTATQKT
jgi:type VI secretion system protein VasJ